MFHSSNASSLSPEEHKGSTICRAGEEERLRFRSKRIFTIDGKYYFTTRECVDVGPFPSRTAAEKAVQLFVKTVSQQENAGIYATKLAMHGVWASTLFQ